MFNLDQEIYPEISNRAGLKPGELVYVGEKRQEHSTLTIIRYNKNGFVDEQELKEVEKVAQLVQENQKGICWINLNGVHNTAWVKALGDLFGAHPLMLEDILNTNQRPKLEDFNETIFLELNMLNWQEHSQEIATEQLSLMMKKGLLITFQESDGDTFDNLRMHIREGHSLIIQKGADYLMHAILDAVIDQYFIVLEKLSDLIEEQEDVITTRPGTHTLKDIHHLKRDLLFLRKSVWPLRELISGLTRGTSPLIEKETIIYLRDIYDNTIQIMDIIETFREMISGLLDVYFSSVSNQMNEIMKVLTIISTLFIPLTFIAGVYGMNFHYMPELRWRWGYFGVLGVMFILFVLMLLYFRRRKWL